MIAAEERKETWRNRNMNVKQHFWEAKDKEKCLETSSNEKDAEVLCCSMTSLFKAQKAEHLWN